MDFLGEKVWMTETSSPLNHLFKMAVLAGVERAVKIHIDRGDDLDARDSSGFTPLMLAASKNRPEICKLLLEAGANDQLIDPSGKVAHAIAVDANSLHAAAVLELSTTFVKLSDADTFHPIESHDLTSMGSMSCELISWEPEENSVPPEADLSASIISKILQKAISNHKPKDSSTEWEDLDLYLPERSLRLNLKDDVESRDRLRLLFLRAIREGSVPIDLVAELSTKQGYLEDFETKALLIMIINDLGAEVDERIENSWNVADFPVFVCSEETTIEEDILYDTFEFIDSLESHQSEPSRLYQKDIQKKKLITGEEEILLGKTMEVELERGIDALASWPKGIAHILAAGNAVRNNQQPLSWFSNSSKEEAENVTPTFELSDIDAISSLEVGSIDVDLESESLPTEGDPASLFLDRVNRLESLTLNFDEHNRDIQGVREALAALCLSRRFLMELAEVAKESPCDSAKQYQSAINLYKRANERMTEANLKLVLHLAKKFLYSGEPLDDLVQEGNLGLLKAVDRFDWRLGFKFSTYATWWIRQSISRHVCDKGRTIRLPVHIHEAANKLSREIEAFEQTKGQSPKVEELAILLNIAPRKVKQLINLPPDAIPIDDLEIDEFIAMELSTDFTYPDPFEIVFQKELSREVDNLLNSLDSKQQEVIRLRNGLGVDEPLTLDEIGKLHGVTRERIRQIEAKAIRKLKHPTRLEYLANNVLGMEYANVSKESFELDEVAK